MILPSLRSHSLRVQNVSNEKQNNQQEKQQRNAERKHWCQQQTAFNFDTLSKSVKRLIPHLFNDCWHGVCCRRRSRRRRRRHSLLLFCCICFSMKIHVRPSSAYYASTTLNPGWALSRTAFTLCFATICGLCERFEKIRFFLNLSNVISPGVKESVVIHTTKCNPKIRWINKGSK